MWERQRFKVENKDLETEIEAEKQENEKQNAEIKSDKKVRIVASAVLALLAVAIVITAIVYANIQREERHASPIPETTRATTTKPTTQPETTEKQIQKVRMTVISTQNDLRIKFYNDKDKLFKDYEFQISVKRKDGNQKIYSDKQYSDQNKSGIIYLTKVPKGEYIVTLTVPEDFECEAPEAIVTVKDKIDYKPITNIKDEVKKESEIDKAKEETKKPVHKDEVVLKDTVEFVKSSQEKYIDYEKVNPADIIIPALPTDPDTTDPSTTKPDSTDPSTTKPDSATVMSLSSEASLLKAENTTNGPDVKERLCDKLGNKLFVKNADGQFIEAFEYIKDVTYYRAVEKIRYYGWQTIDGESYYYDKNAKPVTGQQIISGTKYNFLENGRLPKSEGRLGIDVSKYQGNINWNEVKASGVKYAILRVGYRGWGSGVLVEDDYIRKNLAGARAAGIDVGLYFFSQAVNEVEAVEEASMCIEILNGSRIEYPIFIDIETSGGNGKGRADNNSREMRTKIAIAFCETIKSRGYKAGVYANKNYLTNYMDASRLSQYYIWLAHYTSKTDYAGKYDMWQYSSKGSIPGIKGNVDMNKSYTL